MRLADFIERNTEAILEKWESFARTLLPAAAGLDVATLRDHAAQILQTVVLDLRTTQSRSERVAKSRGEATRPLQTPETAAETHAVLRASGGFSMDQMIAEYRSLRAAVLELWADSDEPEPQTLRDVNRFNEAIDQAVAESVHFFSLESERWRAVFLGVLGHDLRGPLNAILLTSQLAFQMSTGRAVNEVNARLIRSGERMRQLLDELLDYNRVSLDLGIPVSPANIDLAVVCQEEIELQRVAWPKQVIELATEGSTECVGDASRLKQVLGNLIANAAKYGNRDSPIMVRVNASDPEAVVLSVENTGPAIPASGLQTLFEPLSRGGRPSEDAIAERTSLGLGLFIVRQIVQAHRGTVTASSTDGKTVFNVTLPKNGPSSQAKPVQAA